MNNKMLIIGLTGPSGAGKGEVGAVLASLGIPHIDTDRVYHDVITPPSACLDELVAEFGRGILAPDGSLDRAALAGRVFADGHEDEREKLNAITHKYVLEKVREYCKDCEAAKRVAVCVDAPLLFESGFDGECDKVISVLADRETRISRIIARDGISIERARARIGAQKDDGFYISRADAVIYNNGDRNELRSRITDILTDWRVIRL